jgi:hypothetical protein
VRCASTELTAPICRSALLDGDRFSQCALMTDPRFVPWSELVRTKDTRGWTELAWAVENLEIDEVRRLLEAGADPNETIFGGAFTLLHLALDNEATEKSFEDDSHGCEVTKLLIAHGADVTAPDSRGRRPLEFIEGFLDTGARAVIVEALRKLEAETEPPAD